MEAKFRCRVRFRLNAEWTDTSTALLVLPVRPDPDRLGLVRPSPILFGPVQHGLLPVRPPHPSGPVHPILSCPVQYGPLSDHVHPIPARSGPVRYAVLSRTYSILIKDLVTVSLVEPEPQESQLFALAEPERIPDPVPEPDLDPDPT
jgi:hypothetical protein